MDLLLVNVPMDLGKKPYDLAFPFIKRLNFGILAIASYMKEQGYLVGIFDPQALPHVDISNESHNFNESRCITSLLNYIQENKPSYIGLSCISGFSYPNCKEIALNIRKNYPDTTIFVGGKDLIVHLDTPFNRLLKRIKMRGRKIEENISQEHLMGLDSLYNKWINEVTSCLVVKVDTSTSEKFEIGLGKCVDVINQVNFKLLNQ